MDAQPTTEYDDLLFGVRRSVRYHDRRVAFYDWGHRLVLFIALIAGSASMAAFTAEMASGWPHWVKLLPGALVSLAAALDLVFQFPHKARVHALLKQRFIVLEARMHRGQAEDKLIEWTVTRLQIESDEPPVLRVQDTLCHNELLRAMGYPKTEFKQVTWLQRICSPFFDLCADAL